MGFSFSRECNIFIINNWSKRIAHPISIIQSLCHFRQVVTTYSVDDVVMT